MMKYTIKTNLACRGAVDQLADQPIEGIFLVGDIILYEGCENQTDCGVDIVKLFPALHDSKRCFLKTEDWCPANGYSAEGFQQTIIPFEEGIEFLLQREAFAYLWKGCGKE